MHTVVELVSDIIPILFRLRYNIFLFLLGSGLDKTYSLGKFHYYERNENEAETYEVLPELESYKTESILNTGDKRNCHCKNEGCDSGEVKSLVTEDTDLEEGLFASHVVGLNDLTHSENEECHCFAADECGIVIAKLGDSRPVTAATDEECNNIIEVRAWCPYSKTEGFL